MPSGVPPVHPSVAHVRERARTCWQTECEPTFGRWLELFQLAHNILGSKIADALVVVLNDESHCLLPCVSISVSL
jgi:hypothetical protein